MERKNRDRKDADESIRSEWKKVRNKKGSESERKSNTHFTAGMSISYLSFIGSMKEILHNPPIAWQDSLSIFYIPPLFSGLK